MATVQGNLINHNGDKVAPNTTTAAVYDAAKQQALSATLVNTPDKSTLGYPPFSTLSDYAVGDVVYNLTKLWRFISAHTRGAWNAAEVEEYGLKDNVDTVNRFKRDLGYNAAAESVVLTEGVAGKYVKCATRAAANNSNFSISAPFDVDACSELLIKTGYNPSDSDHSALDISVISIYEELTRVRTVQKTDGEGHPLYYVVTYDEEGNPTVTTEETTTDTGYPVYIQETYTESRYLPNNEDRFVAIPDSGYYVANIPQSCKVVVSYKPGVTDTTVVVVKHGALANLTSQIFGVYDRTALSEAIAQLDARLSALESKGDRLGDAQANSIDALEYKSYLYPMVLRGAGAPSSELRPSNIDDDLPWDGIPVFVGQQYMDTTNSKLYVAFGVSSVSNWVALN
ncbi:MAG: hypothetical protein K6G86_08550 [Bacteroidales bacterium]|nr:hypothetical protein [Bacteroidales bacterium]